MKLTDRECLKQKAHPWWKHKTETQRVCLSVYLCAFGRVRAFPGGSAGEESACNAGDVGSVPGLGRSPGERKATHSRILA